MKVIVDTDKMIERYTDKISFVALTDQFKSDSELLCTLFTNHLITSDQLSDMHNVITQAYKKEVDKRK